MRPLVSALALSFLAAGCSTTQDTQALPAVPGLAAVEGDASVEVSFGRLTSALRSAGPVGIVAEVDHQANAATVQLELRPTRVVLFGNPMLGTPLMQANPQAGLDLPQNILVYQDADDRTVLAYNTTDYLAARHGVGGVSTLPTISDALRRFTATAASSGGTSSGIVTPAASVGLNQGVVTVTSPDDVATTYGRLRSAVAGNRNLSIVAELDHQANATSVGMTLPPVRLIVFGNPALGTPLIQAGQTAGIDLPQKMLVYRDAAGRTQIAYNDPAFVASRHGLGDLPQTETIRDALAGLAATAAGR